MALDEFLSEIKIAQVIEFGPMIDILVDKSSNREKVTRHTAIIWLTEFISLGGTRLVNYYAKILGSVMHCISDQEPEIRQQTKVANERLLDLVKSTTEAFELNPLLHALTRELLSEHVTTRVAALLWINMLHEKVRSDTFLFIFSDLLANALFKIIYSLCCNCYELIQSPYFSLCAHNLRLHTTPNYITKHRLRSK